MFLTELISNVPTLFLCQTFRYGNFILVARQSPVSLLVYIFFEERSSSLLNLRPSRLNFRWLFFTDRRFPKNVTFVLDIYSAGIQFKSSFLTYFQLTFSLFRSSKNTLYGDWSTCKGEKRAQTSPQKKQKWHKYRTKYSDIHLINTTKGLTHLIFFEQLNFCIMKA